jgi:hypothetical protein
VIHQSQEEIEDVISFDLIDMYQQLYETDHILPQARVLSKQKCFQFFRDLVSLLEALLLKNM